MTGLNGSFRTETALRDSANSISELLHQLRRQALLQRQVVRIHVEPDGIAAPTESADSNKTSKPPAATAVARLADGVTLNVRDHKGKWIMPEKVEWKIGPDGTVQAERFRLRSGKAYMDFEVNPITGELQEIGFEL